MEQAEDEGRPLEEVALEKYGVSLGDFFTFRTCLPIIVLMTFLI